MARAPKISGATPKAPRAPAAPRAPRMATPMPNVGGGLRMPRTSAPALKVKMPRMP